LQFDSARPDRPRTIGITGDGNTRDQSIEVELTCQAEGMSSPDRSHEQAPGFAEPAEVKIKHGKMSQLETTRGRTAL
jgi:hypothetical protein